MKQYYFSKIILFFIILKFQQIQNLSSQATSKDFMRWKSGSFSVNTHTPVWFLLLFRALCFSSPDFFIFPLMMSEEKNRRLVSERRFKPNHARKWALFNTSGWIVEVFFCFFYFPPKHKVILARDFSGRTIMGYVGLFLIGRYFSHVMIGRLPFEMDWNPILELNENREDCLWIR